MRLFYSRHFLAPIIPFIQHCSLDQRWKETQMYGNLSTCTHLDIIPRKFVIYGGGKPLNFFGLWKELGPLSGSSVALMRLSESTFNLSLCLVSPLQTLRLSTNPWRRGCL